MPDLFQHLPTFIKPWNELRVTREVRRFLTSTFFLCQINSLFIQLVIVLTCVFWLIGIFLTVCLRGEGMKIKPIYYRLLFNLFVSTGMSFFVSLWMHIINVGAQHFIDIWAKNFLISATIAFPVAVCMVFIIDKLMKKMFIIEHTSGK